MGFHLSWLQYQIIIISSMLQRNTINHQASLPNHDPEGYMRSFFGNEYKPGPINWSALQQSTKQQDTIIHRAHNKDWKLSEIITALQYKVPDFSITKVTKLNELEQRLLTELLFKVPREELINKFGKRSMYYLFLA